VQKWHLRYKTSDISETKHTASTETRVQLIDETTVRCSGCRTCFSSPNQWSFAMAVPLRPL